MKPQPNPNGKPESNDKSKIVNAVVNHMMTPEKERQHKSLKQLAKAIGVPSNTYFYNLADSTDVYHELMVRGAGEGIAAIPEILRSLKERALGGSNPAAEIYLNYIRQTITDDKLMKHLKPSIDPTQMLDETLSSAKDLLQLAHALGSDEAEARARMAALREDMVDAEIIEDAG
jgi:hypothetical protein